MTQLYDQAVPIVNLPFHYINGAEVSLDATTPNTKLNIAAGIMRDASNTYDMNIGNYNGQVNIIATENVVTILNAAIVGLNGIDTGTLGVSKVYYVYVISDPVSGLASGALLSLATPVIGPLMPFGYSAYSHVGYAVTDSSSHFLLAYQFGGRPMRLFMYDAPISVGTTASSASFATIDLTKFVPLINNLPVILDVTFTGTANDTLTLQPGNGTGNAVVITAQATAQAQTQQVLVLAQNKLVSSVLSPTINYKNSGTDTVAISVAGFWYNV